MAEKKIGGKIYRVDTVLATTALKIQMRLLSIIGGGVDRLPTILAGMGAKGRENPEAKAASDAALIAALGDIVARADPDKVTDLLGDIVAMAQVQSPSKSWEDVNIDADFTKNKKDLLPVVGFVLVEVLGDFFEEMLASGALAKLEKALG